MHQTTAKRRIEHFTQNRRDQEKTQTFLKDKLQYENSMKLAAKWEQKGSEVDKQNFLKNRLRQLREAQKQDLEGRRARLAELLRTEEEYYREQLQNIEEKPEQVRERMLKRVYELKEQKELARKKEVEEKLERKFKEGADELRKIDSNTNEQKALYERDLQLIKKQKILEDQYQEEMLYAQLWKRDLAKKEKREQEEAIQKLTKNQERNHILNWQRNENEAARQREIENVKKEQQMLRDEREKEAQRLKAQDIATQLFNKQLNTELLQHNMEQKRLKKLELMQEKETDKKMIAEIIAREKALEEIEREQKEEMRKQTRDFLLNFKNRTDEYHTHEAELERLINEEMEKQWEKRAAVWKKEEDQRIKLMYDVYNNREKNVLTKKEIRQMEIQQIELEKKQLEEELNLRKLKEDKRRADDYMKNKQHQQEILKQIAIKTAQLKVKYQEEMEEEKQKRLAELEYQKRIQQEQEKGMQAVNQLRKRLY